MGASRATVADKVGDPEKRRRGVRRRGVQRRATALLARRQQRAEREIASLLQDLESAGLGAAPAEQATDQPEGARAPDADEITDPRWNRRRSFPFQHPRSSRI